MPHKRLDWIILTLVVALLGSAWIGMTPVRASALSTGGKPARAELGYPAPDFTLLTPGGDKVTLSSFSGKPVLINFWATWCAPCRSEIPAFEAAHRQWKDDIRFLGVDLQEDSTVVLPFMSEFGMTYPVVLDTYAEVGRAYRVIALPTTFFINSQGVIVWIENGPLNEALLQTRLAELAGR
jgi:thiol-disulfide isomerase/thioredoxin